MRKLLAVSAASIAAAIFGLSAIAQDQDENVVTRTPQQIVDASDDSLWRPLDPKNTIYMDLPAGLVVIEMRPDFAPKHIAQIRQLVREGFYNGLNFHRVIEGFMAQGGDPKGDGTGGSPLPNIPGEFARDSASVDNFVEIGRDRTAARLGYIDGMLVAAQPEGLRRFTTSGDVKIWGLHCPGVMSMARANSPDSANSQFFLMIGDARSSLDQRYSTWGWIVDGFEATRRISRGEPPTRPTPIMRVRLGEDVPENERRDIKVMRTDTDNFLEYLKARGDVAENGFVKDVCEITVPKKIDGVIER